MRATQASAGASGTAGEARAPVTIVTPDEVRDAIRARGGSVYIWPHVYGVCEGRITLLDVATEPPAGARIQTPFERLKAGDVDVFLSIGSLLWPESIELELHGRRRQLRAYWNGLASVG